MLIFLTGKNKGTTRAANKELIFNMSISMISIQMSKQILRCKLVINNTANGIFQLPVFPGASRVNQAKSMPKQLIVKNH